MANVQFNGYCCNSGKADLESFNGMGEKNSIGVRSLHLNFTGSVRQQNFFDHSQTVFIKLLGYAAVDLPPIPLSG